MQHMLKQLGYSSDVDLPDFDIAQQTMVGEQSGLAASDAADLSVARKPTRRGVASLPPASGKALDKTLLTTLKNLRRKTRARQRAYLRKPTAEWLCGFGLAVFVFFNPLTFVTLALLLLIAGAVAYFTLGYEGFWQKMLGPARWYVARWPDRTERVHKAIDRFAISWDSILDWFPEALVSGLYLPDVSNLAVNMDEPENRFDMRLEELGRAKGH